MRKIIDNLSLGQFEYSDILEIIKNKDGDIKITVEK